MPATLMTYSRPSLEAAGEYAYALREELHRRARFRPSEKKSQKFKFSSNPHFCQSHAARYVDPFTPSIDMIEA